MRLELHADRDLVRPDGGTRHLLVRIGAPPGKPDRSRRPVHVAFVLDRSGSMNGSKLDLAKDAVLQAIAALRSDDRFAVVVYDDRVDVVCPTALATPDARREAAERLAAIESRGCTALHDGWTAGVAEASHALAADTVARCLLLTDGLANRGITSPAELAADAARARARGVVTTAIGVGADFDERLLQGMAEAGGGRFYFVERAAQIPDCLAGELGEALEVVAREVVVEVRVPAGVRVAPLNRYPFQDIGGTLRIAVGDLVAEQELDLVLRLDLPPNAPGEARPVSVEVRDRDGGMGARGEAVFRHASHDDVDRAPRDAEAMRAAAKQYAARAREEALERNRAGDYHGAARVLDDAIRGIRRRARGDEAMLAIAAALERDREELRAPMDVMCRKAMHFGTASMSMDRDVTGRSRLRKPPTP